MLKKLLLSTVIGILMLVTIVPVMAQDIYQGEIEIYPTVSDYEKATGNKLEYKQAPMLKEKVETGELPVLSERLPEEPLVIKPRVEVGQYGGRLRGASVVSGNTGDLFYSNMQYLFRLAPDFKTVVPNLAKDWDLSEDFKTITIYLRKGIKWSDGVEFTTDDVKFWYEDVLLNDELTPVKPQILKAGGELVKLNIKDKYTFQFEFAAPYPAIVDVLAQWDGYNGLPISPKHYLKKYHIKYNEDADELAQKEGYDNWWQSFQFHVQSGNEQKDPDLPVLYPWKLEQIDQFGNKHFVRNPYYWKVDVAGNQLPYIDRELVKMVNDPEVKKMQAISGEIDVAGIWQKIKDYPLYKSNEDEGNYTAMAWMDPRAAFDSSFAFNLTHEDPVLREIFRNLKFRQAMSLAINREEINKSLFFSKGTPRQATVSPSSRFYEKWQANYFIEYDPERANQLLDEIGLEWDKNHKYRLRPDGKTFTITIEFIDRFSEVVQLVKETWEKVGIKTNLKQESRTLLATRKEGNKVDVGWWGTDIGPEYTMRKTGAEPFLPPWGSHGVCYPWQAWFNTNGKEGEEPTETVKQLYDTVQKWQLTQPGSEDYINLGKEIVNTAIENLYFIGGVGLVPYPVVISNRLVNTPGEEGIWFPGWLQWQPYLQEQWYFQD